MTVLQGRQQKPTKMMACFCVNCSEIFMIPSRRGRPPQFCDNCITDKAIPLVARDAAKATKVEVQTPQVVDSPKPATSVANILPVVPSEEAYQDARDVLAKEKETERSRIAALAKVDRLEMMLRSRGTHISQQKDWYK